MRTHTALIYCEASNSGLCQRRLCIIESPYVLFSTLFPSTRSACPQLNYTCPAPVIPHCFTSVFFSICKHPCINSLALTLRSNVFSSVSSNGDGLQKIFIFNNVSLVTNTVFKHVSQDMPDVET